MGLFHKIAAAGLSLMMTVGLLTGCSGNTNQLDLPKKGEEIAVLKVKDYGEMKIRLFPKSAPKAVENFTTHAKNGYYDGLKFHRVIAEFMAQTGDPTGTGMGGESIWGEGFGVEHDKNLSHFTGALGCAQSSQPSSILSIPPQSKRNTGIIWSSWPNSRGKNPMITVRLLRKPMSGSAALPIWMGIIPCSARYLKVLKW